MWNQGLCPHGHKLAVHSNELRRWEHGEGALYTLVHERGFVNGEWCSICVERDWTQDHVKETAS